MYKPKVLGTNFTLGANFAEQEVPVSISVDEFDFTDTTPYKVFVQLEPPDILPTEQRLIDSHTFYDLIITWQKPVLDACPNAVRYIYGNCSWSLNPVDVCDSTQKKFAVSYLTSSKVMCQGHRFRNEVFNKLPNVLGQMPVTKHMSPPVLECKRPLLYPFQYSIIMENGKHINWCTEKLIDCLLSRTIPIYWGAPNVGEFFEDSGILKFDTYDGLKRIVENIAPEFYQSQLSVIDHNFHEAMKYVDVHTRLNESIRRRLSEHYAWTPSNQRPRQEVCERMPEQQPPVQRAFHRTLRGRVL